MSRWVAVQTGDGQRFKNVNGCPRPQSPAEGGSFAIEQGGRCVPLSPLSFQNMAIEEFYGNPPEPNQSNTPTDLECERTVCCVSTEGRVTLQRIGIPKGSALLSPTAPAAVPAVQRLSLSTAYQIRGIPSSLTTRPPPQTLRTTSGVAVLEDASTTGRGMGRVTTPSSIRWATSSPYKLARVSMKRPPAISPSAVASNDGRCSLVTPAIRIGPTLHLTSR